LDRLNECPLAAAEALAVYLRTLTDESFLTDSKFNDPFK